MPSCAGEATGEDWCWRFSTVMADSELQERPIEGVEPRALKIGRHYIDEEYMTLRVR